MKGHKKSFQPPNFIKFGWGETAEKSGFACLNICLPFRTSETKAFMTDFGRNAKTLEAEMLQMKMMAKLKWNKFQK